MDKQVPYNSPREYFILFQPLPILTIYSLQSIIGHNLDEKEARLPGGRDPDIFAFRQLLIGDVTTAEAEFVHWLAKMELTPSLMLDEQLFAEFLEEFFSLDFPIAEKIKTEFERVAANLHVREELLTPDALEAEEIRQLHELLKHFYRRSAQNDLGPFQKWGRDKIDLYFDQYPTDECRIPAMWAIKNIKDCGETHWGIHEQRTFGSLSKAK